MVVFTGEKKSRGTAERQEEPSFVGPFIPTLDAFVYILAVHATQWVSQGELQFERSKP